jgi:HPt (histidine-containing phosphotransfer) domain-containing protein
MRRHAPVAAPDGAFDADAVWALFEGRTDRMAHVWRISRTTMPPCVAALESAAEAGDWAAAARHAHSLAGSAANFGAHALVATARKIEELAGAGGVPEAELRDARRYYEALCTAMTSWLDRVNGESSTPAGTGDSPLR